MYYVCLFTHGYYCGLQTYNGNANNKQQQRRESLDTNLGSMHDNIRPMSSQQNILYSFRGQITSCLVVQHASQKQFATVYVTV